MSIESVRAFLEEKAPDLAIVELGARSTTASVSAAWNIKPAQIAKALSLRIGGRSLMLVACGDARLDNKKVKSVLGGKATFLPPDEATAITGHPVGGVCPFGLAAPMPIYCDVLLRNFDVVATAAGSTHSALFINPIRMAELVGAQWVDVCEEPGQRSEFRMNEG
jgi:prolyl-tRNA editing enzyme YbaK/EbsC (Cys-tRNA(Pro) deacylase)